MSQAWMLITQSIRTAMPYACVSVAGVWAERSGIVQIGLEGILLSTAFAAVCATEMSSNPWIGMAVGGFVGVLFSWAHLAVVHRGVSPIVSGIAFNLFAMSATRLGLRGLYDSASNSPSIVGFSNVSNGNTGLNMFVQLVCDPVSIVVAIAIISAALLLYKTPFGLRVRASGENAEVLGSLGISRKRIQWGAMAVSGVLCALGGIHLAFDQHRFESGMSNGRGFVALAIVVLSGWRIGGAVLASLAFGVLEMIQILIQPFVRDSQVSDFVQLIPYGITLLALAFYAGRMQPPASLNVNHL